MPKEKTAFIRRPFLGVNAVFVFSKNLLYASDGPGDEFILNGGFPVNEMDRLLLHFMPGLIIQLLEKHFLPGQLNDSFGNEGETFSVSDKLQQRLTVADFDEGDILLAKFLAKPMFEGSSPVQVNEGKGVQVPGTQLPFDLKISGTIKEKGIFPEGFLFDLRIFRPVINQPDIDPASQNLIHNDVGMIGMERETEVFIRSGQSIHPIGEAAVPQRIGDAEPDPFPFRLKPAGDFFAVFDQL